MPRLIVVRATWDPEAQVWVAESEDVPGLVTEAESIQALEAKLPNLIQDLLESEEDGGPTIELPVQIISSASPRLRSGNSFFNRQWRRDVTGKRN